MNLDSSLVTVLAVTMIAYVGVMFALSAFAQRRIDSVEDFVVAGRRLGLPLATGTLLATWFGAGTLMAAADEVRLTGLRGAALDPLGAGLCLLLFGAFFARPLWREKIVTLPQLYGRRFGPVNERLAAILMVPPYLGWIAAQFMALAGILELFFGIDPTLGLALVALVGIGYTTLGGMWAVTLTDAFQIALLVVGLLVVSVAVVDHVDGGLSAIWGMLPEGHRVLVPTDSTSAFVGWLGVIAAGSLGNIPSQDVSQRVFSSKSERVAQRACLSAGALYLGLGVIPVLLGLAGAALFGTDGDATVPQLAAFFLSPPMAILFVTTLLSVVLSTIDSALLAPATVLAQDLWPGGTDALDASLARVRWSVVLIGLTSLGLAYAGETAYGLLESGYELNMVSLMAPLVFAVWDSRPSRRGALFSMVSGTLLWGAHFALGVEDFAGIRGVPVGLTSTAFSFVAYALGRRFDGRGSDDRG